MSEILQMHPHRLPSITEQQSQLSQKACLMTFQMMTMISISIRQQRARASLSHQATPPLQRLKEQKSPSSKQEVLISHSLQLSTESQSLSQRLLWLMSLLLKDRIISLLHIRQTQLHCQASFLLLQHRVRMISDFIKEQRYIILTL